MDFKQNQTIYIQVFKHINSQIGSVGVLFDKSYLIDFSNKEEVKFLKEMLRQNNKKVFFGAIRQVAQLKEYGFNLKNVECLKIASKLVLRSADFSFKEICKTILNKEIDFKMINDIDIEYVNKITSCLKALHTKLIENIVEKGIYQELTECILPLAEIKYRKFDPVKLINH